MFKHVFSYELYLDNITNDKRRKTLTPFRLSSHLCLLKLVDIMVHTEMNVNVFYVLKMYVNLNITFCYVVHCTKN